MKVPVITIFLFGIILVGSGNEIKLFSDDVWKKFLGKVFANIIDKQHIEPDFNLHNITVNADDVTSVEFSRLHLFGADKASEVHHARVEGNYEIVSNNVEVGFPRAGKLNVTLSDLFSDVKNDEPPIEYNPDSFNSSINLDSLVDFILLIVRGKLQETGRDKINIPDVDENFRTYIIFPIDGVFKANGGWFKNLSTVYRTSDTVATVNGDTLSVNCALGLKQMEFGFEHYYATFGSIEAEGRLKGIIASNSIDTKISLKYKNGSCIAKLDSLRVVKLDGITVDLDGWGGFKFLLNFIANCTSGIYRNKIIKAVETMLSGTIDKYLGRFQCDHFFKQMNNHN